jgi:hypothetical protein
MTTPNNDNADDSHCLPEEPFPMMSEYTGDEDSDKASFYTATNVPDSDSDSLLGENLETSNGNASTVYEMTSDEDSVSQISDAWNEEEDLPEEVVQAPPNEAINLVHIVIHDDNIEHQPFFDAQEVDENNNDIF